MSVVSASGPSLVESGLARHQAGDLAGAERLYRQALADGADEPLALALLGAVCVDTSRCAEAVSLLRRAVRVRPDWAEGHEQLGLALGKAGDADGAIEALRCAARLGPRLPSAHFNLANALRAAGRRDAAVASYVRAAELAPDFVEALVNLGSTFCEAGRADKAVPWLRRAALLRPDDPVPLRNLGIALREAGDIVGAEGAFRRAAAAAPNNPDVWTDLGGIARQRRDADEALECYRRALDLRPDFAPYHLNVGLAHEDRGEYAEALACYTRALELDPSYRETRLNSTVTRLTMGDWPGGWPVEGWQALAGEEPPRDLGKPRWDGRVLEGKTILVCAEQGYGDTIHFARYLPMVRERCARVVFECQPGLVGLLALSGLADRVVSMQADRSVAAEFDEHTDLMTLPAVFRTTLDTVPCGVPYLRVPEDRASAWRDRLGTAAGLKVGLVWAGNPNHRNDRNRSMRLECLAPLAEMPRVSLYSLQKGPASGQIAACGFGDAVIDLGPELGDFVDTAAALQCMDLLISVDTSVAHLAGALGLPVWMLIPRVPDWRWMLDRSDSPWYPSMRIYRQEQAGRWEPLVADVCRALQSEMPAAA